jgi:HEPN domain-containing protein
MAKTTPPKPPRPKSARAGEAPIAALQSRFDWHRYSQWAPLAERARLAAFVLWRVAGDRTGLLTALWHDARYSYGDASVAMLEGFRRESAVAIELIIKAVIAEQFKLRDASERVPATHDIRRLWQEAGLPQLNREDEHLLLSFKSILNWSGRYATPRKVEN